MRKILIQKI